MLKGSADRTIGPLYIGVDGGGTGCRARIETADGRVLGRGSAGPATLRLGTDRSLDAIETACRAAVDDAELPPGSLGEMDAAIGLAGLGRRGALQDLLAWKHPFRSVKYLGDAMIACLGAHGGRDGGIVIVGTGSIALAVLGDREIRIGGYGFPISDEASGADLGLNALRVALQAYDGRRTATAFTRDVLSRFGHDPVDVVAWADHASATDYATLAPLVIKHATAGDVEALKIVGAAAEQIGAMVRCLIAKGAPRVALLGGLAPAMEPWLPPGVQRHLVAAEGDALDGAVRVARAHQLASG
ncbi:BadF/BadG/BcrA/BcrD ATPase family protein [Leptospira interrogans]